ncbi:MAG: prepilin-type N-terminal cleavage/methylation domain-containing protein [Lentisphaerae bacterium]|nr:prepilin-type N-terminal cleavage/methylation domain-containing protein [Lentisphaerota bacterium]MCP4102254.1 prepilin-type N-terminal cleavage/methylation domain-containing protein [Lentisphaerota bacterium]
MKRSEAGFTLFEVMLAIGIFAVISFLVASILFGMQRSWIKIKINSHYLNNDRGIDRIADYAFRNAVPFNWPDQNRRPRQIFTGASNSMTLAYLHRVTAPAQGGIRFIRLFVRNKKLIAAYRNSPIIYWVDENLDEHSQQEVIADNVESISFLYADRINGAINWTSDWNPEKPYIPLAVQMTLKFQNGDSVSWLRRTAGSSYETHLGRR